MAFINDLFNFAEADKFLTSPILIQSPSSGVDFIKSVRDLLLDRDEDLLGEYEETRCLFINEEFESQLGSMIIPANQLTTYLHLLSDGRQLTYSNDKIFIELDGIHFASIYHTVPPALAARLDYRLIEKSFANRLLIVGMPKPEYALPSPVSASDFATLQDKIRKSLQNAGQRTKIEMEQDSINHFVELEHKYFQPDTGNHLKDALLCRLGRQCLKVALNITLINGEEKISLTSMEAACKLIEYSKETIDAIFGKKTIISSRFDS